MLPQLTRVLGTRGVLGWKDGREVGGAARCLSRWHGHCHGCRSRWRDGDADVAGLGGVGWGAGEQMQLQDMVTTAVPFIRVLLQYCCTAVASLQA